MKRLFLVLGSVLLVAIWSTPAGAAEDQGRARKRGGGGAQSAPKRSGGSRASAPRRAAPAPRTSARGGNSRKVSGTPRRGRVAARDQAGGRPRGQRAGTVSQSKAPNKPRNGRVTSSGRRGGSTRALPRRAPRQDATAGNGRGRVATGTTGGRRGLSSGRKTTVAGKPTRVVAGGRAGERTRNPAAATGGRRGLSSPTTGTARPRIIPVSKAAGGALVGDQSRQGFRPGAGRTPGGRGAGGRGAIDRRPRRGNVVGSAVRRPELSSRPIVINNYNGGRRGRGFRGYTPYHGRHRHGAPHVYGSYFYFPGYSTFSVGFGGGYGYASYDYSRYDPYWYGHYGHTYGYNAYDWGQRYDYYTGSLRLKVQPRFAEVYVDGYYVGLVNDYDGIFQRLRLEEGPHHIEIRDVGFLPLEFEVMILPGETITYEGYLEPVP